MVQIILKAPNFAFCQWKEKIDMNSHFLFVISILCQYYYKNYFQYHGWIFFCFHEVQVIGTDPTIILAGTLRTLSVNTSCFESSEEISRCNTRKEVQSSLGVFFFFYPNKFWVFQVFPNSSSEDDSLHLGNDDERVKSI